MLVPLILIILAGAAIAGGLALGRLEIGGPLGVRAAPNSPGGTNPGGLMELQIEAAKDFDPQGSDGSEHPEDTGAAIDGDRATAWATDHYKSAQFGGLKDGLGLWLDLGRRVRIEQINVVSPLTGWTFEVKAGSSPAATAAALPATDGSTSFTIGPKGTTVVDLKAVRTSGLLIWITELASDSGRYAASIAEVTVEGPH
jgi:hypothetical protein